MSAIATEAPQDDLLIFHFTHVPNDQEFENYLRTLDGLLDRRRRYAVILDVQTKELMPRSQRRAQAEWMKRRRTDLEKFCAGTAFVFQSAVYRFVLSSIFLLQPIPTPYEICANVDEALAWARQKL